ncbi:unnamed protein product [Rhizophagus irregularis]|nr:unnamed protein product [Rhizophagus irregularis]
MFIDGEIVRSTCSDCRSNNKIRKKQSRISESEIQLIEFEELTDNLLIAIDQHLDLYGNENKENSNKTGFEFKIAINISSLSENPKTIADTIIEAIQNADEYKWTYSRYYQHKNSTASFWYTCAQRCSTLRPPRKHPDINKQRDVTAKERFNCNGTIKLLINTYAYRADIHITHDDLHILPNDFSVPDWIKDYLNQGMPIHISQKQVHYWWSHYMIKKYKRKEDAYDSACEWLYERDYEIIIKNKEPARALGFLTGFHKELQERNIQINECGVDATYNTNNLTFELYVLHAEFFLTDKDFAQISAGQAVWPNAKIQLCHWHLRRAIEMKLKDTKLPKRDNYEPIAANHKFSFIDINFNPSNNIYKATRFCPKEHHEKIWNLMNKHMHQHPLIPPYITAYEIRKNAVFEMYFYCKENLLVWMWSYLWREWYCDDRWILWTRSACSTLSILKTTMFIEGHWKVLKWDFLYKFFRPRLDLLTYIILEKLIPLQQRKFQQILSGRETLEWQKSIKAEWKKLLLRKTDNLNHHGLNLIRPHV